MLAICDLPRIQSYIGSLNFYKERIDLNKEFKQIIVDLVIEAMSVMN